MKPPAFQFYPGDWMKDPSLSMCSPMTRGIWMDVLCAMWESPARGELSGTFIQLSRIARCTPDEMLQAVRELAETQTCTVTFPLRVTEMSQDVTQRVTLVSRRMTRDNNNRKNNALRQSRHRSNSVCNANSNKEITLPSSSSSSSSKVREEKNKAKKEAPTDVGFTRFWEAYPLKKGKGQALKAWNKLKPSDELVAMIVSAIATQTRERQSLHDAGEFVPEWKYPATWLSGECWLDETRRPAAKAERRSFEGML